MELGEQHLDLLAPVSGTFLRRGVLRRGRYRRHLSRGHAARLGVRVNIGTVFNRDSVIASESLLVLVAMARMGAYGELHHITAMINVETLDYQRC